MTILSERLFRNLDKCSSILIGDIRALRIEDMVDPKDVPLTRMDAGDIPETTEQVGSPIVVSNRIDGPRGYPRRRSGDGDVMLKRSSMGANAYVVGDVEEVYMDERRIERFSVKFYRI